MIKTKNIGGLKPLLVKYDTNNIKNRCFICGKYINNSEELYEERGNCCSECSGRAGRVVELVSRIDNLRNKITNIKSGKLPKDMKDFTDKEIKARVDLYEKDLDEALKDLKYVDSTHPYIN